MSGYLLSAVCFIPAIAALILLLFLRGDDEAAQLNAKRFALVTTTVTFLISLGILSGFDPSNTGFQFVEETEWLLGLKYKMGVDGISVLFVMLTTFIMPLTILASWGVTTRVKEYMIAFLMLETLMLGVFMALDLVLFYLFFEAGLIPMFLIIGIWGGKDRIYASFKFFLYTLLGSVLMLVAMIAMFMDAGTTDIPSLMAHNFGDGQLKSMAENWIDIEDQPMIIEAELEDHIQRVEALEDAAAGPGDDDSEPEMEIDSSDDDMELPDSATAQNWIDLIKQAAPGLGVPGEAVEHLDKFSRALRKAKLERAGRDASLHSCFSLKPAAKGGQG